MDLTENKKEKIISAVKPAAFILFLSVIQNVDGWFPAVSGSKPLFLIPAVVTVAMFRGAYSGVLFGAYAGLLWDCFTTGNNFTAAYLAVAGFAAGELIRLIMRNNIATGTILSSLAALVYTVFRWFFKFFLTGTQGAFLMFFKHNLITFIYTVVFIPLIFILMKKVLSNGKEGAYIAQ
ncbi:MAG: rod shape-determining protein MreD [Clostridiales bacterium]|nr:rod shape-determining protein MreD [Clostridiales bacterium]